MLDHPSVLQIRVQLEKKRDNAPPYNYHLLPIHSYIVLTVFEEATYSFMPWINSMKSSLTGLDLSPLLAKRVRPIRA